MQPRAALLRRAVEAGWAALRMGPILPEVCITARVIDLSVRSGSPRSTVRRGHRMKGQYQPLAQLLMAGQRLSAASSVARASCGITLNLTNNGGGEIPQVSGKAHRQQQQIRLRHLPYQNRGSIYWAVVLRKPRTRSQSVRLGWSPVLNHGPTLVRHRIRCVRAKGERVARLKLLHHLGSKSLVGWENSGDDLGNFKSPRCSAKSVGHLDCRSREVPWAGREYVGGVNWLRADNQGVASGTVRSKAVPTSRSKHADAQGRFVVCELLGRLVAQRHGSAGTFRGLHRPGLAIRSAAYERNGN